MFLSHRPPSSAIRTFLARARSLRTLLRQRSEQNFSESLAAGVKLEGQPSQVRGFNFVIRSSFLYIRWSRSPGQGISFPSS